MSRYWGCRFYSCTGERCTHISFGPRSVFQICFALTDVTSQGVGPGDGTLSHKVDGSFSNLWNKGATRWVEATRISTPGCEGAGLVENTTEWLVVHLQPYRHVQQLGGRFYNRRRGIFRCIRLGICALQKKVDEGRELNR